MCIKGPIKSEFRVSLQTINHGMLTFLTGPERILRGIFIRMFVYCAFDIRRRAHVDKYGPRYIDKWGPLYMIYKKWSPIPESGGRFRPAHILDIAQHILRINGYEQAIATEVLQMRRISGM
jgi:hypothetical protein